MKFLLFSHREAATTLTCRDKNLRNSMNRWRREMVFPTPNSTADLWNEMDTDKWFNLMVYSIIPAPRLVSVLFSIAPDGTYVLGFCDIAFMEENASHLGLTMLVVECDHVSPSFNGRGTTLWFFGTVATNHVRLIIHVLFC